ncbi:MAG: hypothetical protein CMG09_06410 [Candidatus Marinimicrobia bacterium]|nr:hypothetical protein [Candidatus Neomarinimicrobiota bacterium]|tara:strand:+ start:3625 stop:4014 length:390 start_codon:yes stop_codon:yes gene_type:complete
MKYSYSKDINLNFKDTEQKVRDALMEIGFGVLTEINMKDAFKAKLNLDYKNYKILGACNPTLAYDALSSENLIGILMPCNILVIDNENQTTKIVFPYAKSLLEITDNDDIYNLADNVDDLLKSAFDKIN